MACGGFVLSAGSVAFGRCAASVFEGLWQRTHISTSLRLLPCTLKSKWHWLQFATSAMLRLGWVGDPSTEKYATLLSPPYCRSIWLTVPGRSVSVRRPATRL